MSDFHITFKKESTDKYSTGVNIEADSMLEALVLFSVMNESVELIAIVDKSNNLLVNEQYKLVKVCELCESQFN